MDRKRNYQRELDEVLREVREAGGTPSLLLHSCCAPCSSYVLEYLSAYFEITDFYYNPNITDAEEYAKRTAEMKQLVNAQPHQHTVTYLEGAYEPETFFEAARGFENCPEGGERCLRCFELRLRETARVAAGGGAAAGTPSAAAAGEAASSGEPSVAASAQRFDFFTTTLTISPLKDADALNRIGEAAAAEYGVRWLPSDFKKKGGYQRSVELSREYELYRQNYCGCVFSRRDLQGK